jgi:hypothetical protein
MKQLIILFLCIFHLDTYAKTQADAFGGDEQLSIILKPESVWIQRIEVGETNLSSRASFKTLSKQIPIPKEDAAVVSRLIADSENIRWGVTKGCVPRPGILFGFTREKRLIEVAVCLECSMFFVFENGSMIGGQHCDKTSRDLLQFALRHFPNDKAMSEQESENKKADKRNKAISPKDGSKLKTVKGVLQHDGVIIWIMRSETDGSILVYDDDRGVYDPMTLPKDKRESILKEAADPR